MSKYVEILFRHRLRFFILLVVLPAGLAAACIVLFPHKTAVSSLWVDTPAYVPVSNSGWDQYRTPAQNTVDALNQLRSTDTFVQQLGAKLDANNTFASAGERASVLSTVTTDVVVLASGSHLVVLTDSCPREPVCSNVLVATETLYHQWLMDQQTAQLKVALEFWKTQLATDQAQADKDQQALSDAYRTHTVLPFDPQVTQLTQKFEVDQAAATNAQKSMDAINLSLAALSQIDSAVFKVMDPPHTVGGTLSGLPSKQMLIAAGTAFAFGIAVLVLMAWSDRTTREPRELESILRIPVVATIPDLRLT